MKYKLFKAKEKKRLLSNAEFNHKQMCTSKHYHTAKGKQQLTLTKLVVTLWKKIKEWYED